MSEGELTWLIDTLEAENEADKPLTRSSALALLKKIASKSSNDVNAPGIQNGYRLIPKNSLSSWIL